MKKLVLIVSAFAGMSISAAQKPAPQAEVKREVGAAEKIRDFEGIHFDLAADMYRFVANWLDELNRKPTAEDQKKLLDDFAKKYRTTIEELEAPSVQSLVNHYVQQAIANREQEEVRKKIPPILGAPLTKSGRFGVTGYVINLEAAAPLWNLIKTVQLPFSKIVLHGPEVGISRNGSTVVYSYNKELHTIDNAALGKFPVGDFVSLVLSRKGNRIVAGTINGLRQEAECIGGLWSNPNYTLIGDGNVSVAVNDDGTYFASSCGSTLIIETSEGKQEINLGSARVLDNTLLMNGPGTIIALVLARTVPGQNESSEVPCFVHLVTREKEGWKLSEKPIMTFSSYPFSEELLAMNKTGTVIAASYQNAVRVVTNEGNVWRVGNQPVMIFGQPGVSVNIEQLLMSDDGSVIVAQAESSRGSPASVQVASQQSNGQWQAEYLRFSREGSNLTVINADASLIVGQGRADWGGQLFAHYWNGLHYNSITSEEYGPAAEAHKPGKKYNVPKPFFIAPNARPINALAMSADGTTVVCTARDRLYVIENPVLKYASELSTDQLQFLQDLARAGKGIIRFSDAQFKLLESMPWPVIRAVLKRYLISWTPVKTLGKEEAAKEQVRLSGYKSRLQEKKKKWDAQHEAKKKAGEQKKEAEEEGE